MKRTIAIAAVAFAVWAVATPGHADTVLLRQDCTGLSSCYTDLATLVWDIWTVILPSEANPLLVDIGPGEFQGPFVCPSGRGWVTLRGSGRDQTRIVKTGGSYDGAVDVVNCEKLHFQDLSLVGDVFGVKWDGAGSSSWTDVEIRGGVSTVSGWAGVLGIGWYDGSYSPPCLPEQQAVHYFFNTRIVGQDAGTQVTALLSRCSQNWFFGGELTATYQPGATGGVTTVAVWSETATGDVRVFGTTVRAFLQDAAQTTQSVEGVRAMNGAIFHAHGSIVNADASASASDVPAIGLNVPDINGTVAQLVHTPGTAFSVKPGGAGTATRIAGVESVVDSPFLWPAATDEPAGGLASKTGEDLFVETDCDASGDCSGAGAEPHLMVYDEGCAPTPWRDSSTGRCRGDTVDPVADQLQDLEARVQALEALHGL